MLQDSLSFEDSSGEGSDSGPEEEEEESDSSEDEAGPRNTVGDVPLEWYKDEEHIGYDVDGRKIKKRDREGRIQAFLDNVDSDTNWYIRLLCSFAVFRPFVLVFISSLNLMLP